MDLGSEKSSFESRHHVKVLKIHIQVDIQNPKRQDVYISLLNAFRQE